MERSSRPVRNRRHSRKTWPSDMIHRPVKRLFTPEIKKMLKEWLIRRRDNPYPSRDEKKTLAHETGLTYTQICNWFANWRRKLKNSGKERQQKTWGNLIKNYNHNAKGSAEQFSICSEDSIWGECDTPESSSSPEPPPQKFTLYENFYVPKQCFQITSTTEERPDDEQDSFKSFSCFSNANKYKSHIMEKYLRGLESAERDFDTNNNSQQIIQPTGNGPELSKWLESTANFRPSKHNYIDWDVRKSGIKKTKNRHAIASPPSSESPSTVHEKEELDAAEALTKLALNFRAKYYSAASVVPS